MQKTARSEERAVLWFGGPSGRGRDVPRASTLRARLDVEGHLLAAVEAVEVEGRGETVAVEEVILPVLAGDEAESAIGDDLLDGAGGHCDLLSLLERVAADARSV